MRELVSLIDLPPTLLDAAGIPVPADMQGHSLRPLMRRETLSWQEEVFVQISEAEVGRALRTQRWKYGVIAPGKDGVRDSGSERYQEAYLYDLRADPYELENLIHSKAHAAVCAELKERLTRRMVDAGEKPPDIAAAQREWVGQLTVTDKAPYI